MSKRSFIDKDSSGLSRPSNNSHPSFEPESPSNKVAASASPVCSSEPLEVFQRSKNRDLLLHAQLLQKRRASRAAHFPKEMFGEVAWDIMIALYVEEKGHSLSITAISMPIQVPMSTLLRWVTYLEINMLVVTVPVLTDARVRLLQMTDSGRNAMDDCMTDLLQI